MDISQKIKTATVYAGMTDSALCERLGTSKSAFSQKKSRAKFSVDELENIARLLGAELTVKFKFPDGTEI